MWAILAVPKKMQLYKDQLRNKHASFHQEIQPAVKRMLFTQDTETAEKRTLLSASSWKHATFRKATLPSKELLA